MKIYSVLIFLFVLTGVMAQKSDPVTSVEKFQKKINQDFKSVEHSPLPAAVRKEFKTLEFFPVDTSFALVAEFIRTPFEMPFQMPTTTERKPMYLKYGEVYFYLKGKEHKLNVYQNLELVKNPGYRDYLFLPFTDLSNGESSYSGGRYLDLKIPKSNRMFLDFNKSYNPYCAYNGSYSCPIPPKENHLDVVVNVGVKDYKKKEILKKP
jgi:uncharacterized protein